MATLEKIEFEEFGPYRFIGRSVYARPWSGDIFGGMWCNSGHIFEALDKLSDYETTENDKVALLTWDKYSEEKPMMGYTVGRFMKAETPVPQGLDYFDIPLVIVAKGSMKGIFCEMIQNQCTLTHNAIKEQTKYSLAECKDYFEAEVYTKDTIPEDGVESTMKYYISCKK